MIPLKKSIEKEYSTFVFPYDDGVDKLATKMHVFSTFYPDKSMLLESKIKMAKDFDPEITEEMVVKLREQFIDEEVSMEACYAMYVKSNYDVTIFKGQPAILIMEQINSSELQEIGKKVYKVGIDKLEKEMAKPSNASKLNEYIKSILESKLVKVENREEYSNKEIIELVASDVTPIISKNEFNKFITQIVLANNTKKKTLKSSVE